MPSIRSIREQMDRFSDRSPNATAETEVALAARGNHSLMLRISRLLNWQALGSWAGYNPAASRKGWGRISVQICQVQILDALVREH